MNETYSYITKFQFQLADIEFFKSAWIWIKKFNFKFVPHRYFVKARSIFYKICFYKIAYLQVVLWIYMTGHKLFMFYKFSIQNYSTKSFLCSWFFRMNQLVLELHGYKNWNENLNFLSFLYEGIYENGAIKIKCAIRKSTMINFSNLNNQEYSSCPF